MAFLNKMWFATLTKPKKDWYGTDSKLVAIVTSTDQVDLLHHTLTHPSQSDQEVGEANLYEVDVSGKGIWHSGPRIRIGIRGSDQWNPELAMAWGEDTTGVVRPMAMETEMTVDLSTDSNEGPLSVPLKKLYRGGDGNPIHSLLMLMTTATSTQAGTNSRIELDVTHDNAVSVHYEVPETPQSDQELGEANLYRVPVQNWFRKDQLEADSISLRIKGQDMWTPASFFLFGLDAISGRPLRVVPLVHLPVWPHGSMSTDSTEGKDHVTLTQV